VCNGRRGERGAAYRVLVVKPEGRCEHLEDLDVDVRIILKCALKK
jgi:hypothetical protein